MAAQIKAPKLGPTGEFGDTRPTPSIKPGDLMNGGNFNRIDSAPATPCPKWPEDDPQGAAVLAMLVELLGGEVPFWAALERAEQEGNAHGGFWEWAGALVPEDMKSEDKPDGWFRLLLGLQWAARELAGLNAPAEPVEHPAFCDDSTKHWEDDNAYWHVRALGEIPTVANDYRACGDMRPKLPLEVSLWQLDDEPAASVTVKVAGYSEAVEFDLDGARRARDLFTTAVELLEHAESHQAALAQAAGGTR